MFPRNDDADKETIHLVGKKEEVAKVKAKLEKLVAELVRKKERKREKARFYMKIVLFQNENEEIFFDVPTQWHRHFVQRGGKEVREIQANFGGVIVSFPSRQKDSTRVSVKGAKDCVEGAKQRILEVVADLVSAARFF